MKPKPEPKTKKLSQNSPILDSPIQVEIYAYGLTPKISTGALVAVGCLVSDVEAMINGLCHKWPNQYFGYAILKDGKRTVMKPKRCILPFTWI